MPSWLYDDSSQARREGAKLWGDGSPLKGVLEDSKVGRRTPIPLESCAFSFVSLEPSKNNCAYELCSFC